MINAILKPSKSLFQCGISSFCDFVKRIFGSIKNKSIHNTTNNINNDIKYIDKILKKCGEEASEIIIAAKNPNAEELKYEIADFLYHMMVIMAECGLTWEDITRELANRR